MSDRLPWFRCFPSALLGALAGLTADEGFVYVTVLLRIYETGGPVSETGRTLARRTGLSEKKATAALAALVEVGKVQRLDGAMIDCASTHDELAWQQDRRFDQSTAGAASAAKRAASKRQNAFEEKDDASGKKHDLDEGQKPQRNQQKPATTVQRPSNHKEKEGEDNSSLPPADAGPVDVATKLPADWQPDAEDIAAALAEGLLIENVPYEAAQFRDRMHERGLTSHNWRASWRRWCRSPFRKGGEHDTGQSRRRTPTPTHPRPGNPRAAVARKYAAALLGDHDERAHDFRQPPAGHDALDAGHAGRDLHQPADGDPGPWQPGSHLRLVGSR